MHCLGNTFKFVAAGDATFACALSSEWAAQSVCGVNSKCCAVIVIPVCMHGSDIIVTQTFKWQKPANLEGRPGEDGSPVGGDKTQLEGSSFFSVMMY